jgi:LuxR family transcriptional regulator of csgAB operon
MERNTPYTSIESSRLANQASPLAAGEQPASRDLPVSLLLGDASIQNRLLGQYLLDYGICRSHMGAPSQLGALLQCERPALIILDIRSADRGVATILEDHAGATTGPTGLPPTILINLPASVDAEQFLTRREIVGAFHDNEPFENLLSKIRQLLAPSEATGRRRQREAPVEALTRKEMTVLQALAQGLSNDHIADKLSVSPHTVKTHLYNAYRKIGCTNRVAAAMWAQRSLRPKRL